MSEFAERVHKMDHHVI